MDCEHCGNKVTRLHTSPDSRWVCDVCCGRQVARFTHYETNAITAGSKSAHELHASGTHPEDLQSEGACPAYADRALVECWWAGFLQAADDLIAAQGVC